MPQSNLGHVIPYSCSAFRELMALSGADGTFLHDGVSALTKQHAQLSVSLRTCWLFFHALVTGSVRELGGSLLSGGHSVGTLALAVRRIPDSTVGG